MSLPNKKTDALYTYADYITWDDDERWEIIDGVPYLMAPAASPSHQGISMDLSRQVSSFLKGGSCKVFHAPFDVRLFPTDDNSDNTVVQPDIVVICDIEKIDKRGLSGVPDLVIEILSPSNIRHDMLTKFNLYRRAGVPEYWIVDPEGRYITVYTYDKGNYVALMYGKEETVPVHVVPGLTINLSEVFDEIFETEVIIDEVSDDNHIENA
ncbi:MAG: Uma2 family endonuclease [Oscillospiraceae bacterium]|nr:Uma2 family endonuclease [Oscillospiraceae bacterium]